MQRADSLFSGNAYEGHRFSMFDRLPMSPRRAAAGSVGGALAGPPAAWGQAAGNREVQYQWDDGAEFGYSFDIEANVEGTLFTVKGTSIYRPAAGQRPGAGGSGTGTAFVVNKDGYLVTCAHVVHGGTKFMVKLGDNEVAAKVIEVDTEHDVALLQIPLRNLPALPLGDSHKVQLAQQVRVVGYPLSDVLGSSIKVTSGSIAGIVEHEGQRLLQVDASINPGNSGGPVVNNRGEVVGVASAKLVGMEVSNVGFAVPVEEARRLLEKKGISIAAVEAGESLAGPELAKRVTPSVGLVTVTIGPGGVGTGKAYRLAFRGTREMTNRGKSDSAAAAEPKQADLPRQSHRRFARRGARRVGHADAAFRPGVAGVGGHRAIARGGPREMEGEAGDCADRRDRRVADPVPRRAAPRGAAGRARTAVRGPFGSRAGRPPVSVRRSRSRPSWSFRSWKRSNTGCGGSRPTGP